ncbi:MAG TPA: SRPBCC family protein [Acidimicrobiales bacterium]|nr:SRPBCC family protein [Acidimicrobiales bacterium]
MGYVIEVSTTIATTPEEAYAALADITRMGEWSPECTGGSWLGGATTAAPGAKFRGSNRNGFWRWSTTCTVVTAEPGKEVAWESRVFGRPVALWRYRFEAAGDGATMVTESTEDRRGTLFKAGGPLASGVGDREMHNRRSMEATLERVKRVLEGDRSPQA